MQTQSLSVSSASSAGNSVSVLTADQATLVDQVRTYHAGVRKSFEHQVQYAFMAGLKLLALKDTCAHGNAKGAQGFIAIREAFLPEVSKSAAGRYMDFTSLVQEKFPSVGNIRPANLLLENGELPEKEKAQVLKAVHDAADGKTWTQFYRDLDLCRQKKPAGGPRKTISPEDAETAAKQAADDLAKSWLADSELLMQHDTWSLLSTDRQHQIKDLRLTLGTFIKKNSGRARSPQRASSAKG